MANFFKKLARIVAIVLAVIATVLLIIACCVYAGVGTALIPAIKGGFIGWLVLAACAAVVAVMVDPTAAMSILSRCFDATGRIVTAAFDKVLDVGLGIVEKVSDSFFSSPIGMSILAIGGVLLYKTLKGPGDKNDHPKRGSEDFSRTFVSA